MSGSGGTLPAWLRRVRRQAAPVVLATRGAEPGAARAPAPARARCGAARGGRRAGVRAADPARAVGLRRHVVARRPGSGGPISPRPSSGRRSCRAGSCATPSTWSPPPTTPRSPTRSAHARRAQWLRADKRAAGLDMPAVAAAVRRYLADGPLTQPRLVALLEADGFPRVAWVGRPAVGRPAAGAAGRARGRSRGRTCSRSPDAASLPDRGDAGGPSTTAQELLVTRYLRAFGPASAADVASFTGLPLAEVRAVLARCDLRRFRSEAGGELVDVPDGAAPGRRRRRRRCASWAPGTPRCSCTRGAPSCCRRPTGPRVFATSMPRSVPTFLVDGQVAGTWAYAGGQVVTTPVPRPARARPAARSTRRPSGSRRSTRPPSDGSGQPDVRRGGHESRAARRAGVRRRSRDGSGGSVGRPCRTASANRATRARRTIHAVMAGSLRSASSCQQWRRRHPSSKILPVH